MSVQLNNFGMRMFYLLLILTASLSSSSVVRPSSCFHQPHSTQLNTSKWANRLQTENQISNLNDLNLQNEVRLRLSDLAGLIHVKKNRFTRDELRRSYNFCDLALKTMSYDFLVSSTNSTSPNDLSGAYSSGWPWLWRW